MLRLEELEMVLILTEILTETTLGTIIGIDMGQFLVGGVNTF